MIICDYSGIAVSGVFSQVKPDKIEENFIRHIILNSLRMYNLKYRDKYGSMVIACDGGSWRKDYFPEYKGARRKNREASGLDWTEIFRIINKIKDEISEFLPYAVIQHPKAEADDVIATLVETTQQFGNYEPVMIVSADKDFIQLQKYDNVQQFSPLTKKQVTDKNPQRYLLEHVFKGDSSDGVPNVLSADRVFLEEGSRQTPLRANKIEEWCKAIANDTLQAVMPDDIYRNYIRNLNVIDLSKTPDDIKAGILEAYDNRPTKGNSKVLNYLISQRCNLLISCVNEFFHK
jgi:hypothetical protein